MREAMILVYCAAVGFVVAGATASLYQLVTTRPPRFVMPRDGWLAMAAQTALFTFAGPMLMLRLVQDGRLARGALSWVLAGLAICGLWSCCLGILLVHLALSAT